mmetsp:Transcript_14690/g.29847  ORF Transcript_14690/g.29847 Transcript_14690/m.29847 type:complete len:262 (-) Transcript_14690:173-958(-)
MPLPGVLQQRPHEELHSSDHGDGVWRQRGVVGHRGHPDAVRAEGGDHCHLAWAQGAQGTYAGGVQLLQQRLELRDVVPADSDVRDVEAHQQRKEVEDAEAADLVVDGYMRRYVRVLVVGRHVVRELPNHVEARIQFDSVAPFQSLCHFLVVLVHQANTGVAASLLAVRPRGVERALAVPRPELADQVPARSLEVEAVVSADRVHGHPVAVPVHRPNHGEQLVEADVLRGGKLVDEGPLQQPTRRQVAVHLPQGLCPLQNVL